ncbi:MAG TPA: cytochrome c [Candidatus Binataceae bacterium]|nr:cytochrome c [Candidatus Binataceae bacterium]
MYSRFQLRKSVRTVAIAALAIVLGAALRKTTAVAQDTSWYQSGQLPYLPESQIVPSSVFVSQIFPGLGSPPPEVSIAKQYQGNPFFINEGHRYYLWYNCVGCHANGGGGMGPALMDNQWRYGGRLDQIFASIYQGRPNGMPSWGGKIPDGQIWELAAFVKALSAPSTVKQVPGETLPKPPPPDSGAPGSPQMGSQSNVQQPAK